MKKKIAVAWKIGTVNERVTSQNKGMDYFSFSISAVSNSVKHKELN